MNQKNYRHLTLKFSYWSKLLYYTLKIIGNTEKVVSWKSKGASDEKHATPTTSDNSVFPSINWYKNLTLCLIFKASCLKQKKTQLILLLTE